MTEPTIKEKINNFFSEPGIGYYDIEMSKKDLYNYTRLICEEMTGKMIIPAETFGDQGYNVRVAENEVKAQEILKALE